MRHARCFGGYVVVSPGAGLSPGLLKAGVGVSVGGVGAEPCGEESLRGRRPLLSREQVDDASPHPVMVELVQRLVGRQRREIGPADGLEDCELVVELLGSGTRTARSMTGLASRPGTEVEPMC